MTTTERASASLKKIRLTDRQRELVGLLRVDDNRVVFGSEERIPDWPALKKVMVALGGKWTPGRKGALGCFLFSDEVDATELVRLAVATGEILDPNEHDFFPTPAPLAARLVALAQIDPGMSVLEPSAGRGALALAIRAACPSVRVVCVEAISANITELSRLGFTVAVGSDFLAHRAPEEGRYDRVVMNPPFSRRADIHHVTHALKFLRHGGRLAAIMSAGVAFRQDKLATEFRALVQQNAGTIEANPAGSFRESGTMVNTVMVTMRKGG